MSYKKVILLKNDAETLGFDTPNEAIDAAVSGDLVILYPGNYTSTIILKDGVNMQCIGRVNISSTNPNGTLWDGGMQANIDLKGFPTISNTNGLDKRITLGHPSSSVTGFHWEFVGKVERVVAGSGSILQVHNTLGSALSVVDLASPNTFYITPDEAGAFPANKTAIHFTSANLVDRGSGDAIEVVESYIDTEDRIDFRATRVDGTFPTGSIITVPTLIHIKVFP